MVMFETPTLDIQELRSVLTDAGHTAVGFATMAAKRANDVRLDLNDRYDEQTKDLRTNMLTVVEKFADVRTKVEARIDPVIETLTDRLPAPARKVVENLTDSVKEAQAKAHKFVVDALTVEASKTVAKPVVKPSAKKTATTSAKTTKVVKASAVKVVKASAAKKTAAKAPVAKKTAAKKSAAKKPVARTTTARTTTARKSTARNTSARKAA